MQTGQNVLNRGPLLECDYEDHVFDEMTLDMLEVFQMVLDLRRRDEVRIAAQQARQALEDSLYLFHNRGLCTKDEKCLLHGPVFHTVSEF